MRKILFMSGVLLILAVPASSAHAQMMKPPVSVGFFGGLAFPTGDFGSTSSSGAGGASTGFAFGGELGIPLPGGLSILGSATLAFNALSEEYVKSASGVVLVRQRRPRHMDNDLADGRTAVHRLHGAGG